jgi:uncharacterized protein (DUF305 family)
MMIGMRASRTFSVSAIVLAAVGMAACSSATQRTQQSPAQVRQPYTQADVHFMSAMIAHHAQAIDISRWAPTHGASAPLQVLAERVINAQQDEIRLMQQWLRDRQLPVPEARATTMTTGMGGAAHEHPMPGMLSPDQLNQLDQARETDFDQLFLTFMIQHHRGAVTMVEELFRSQGAALDDTVFKLAADISADQSAEIDRMQKMLFTLTTGIPTP